MVLETHLVKKNQFVTHEDLIDAITLARLGPGATSANVVAFLGNKIYGFCGGILATICYTVFPLIIITAISSILDKIMLFSSVRSALRGCLICISALSIKSNYDMAKSILINEMTIVVFSACFVFSAFFNISGILLIISSALLGIFSQILNVHLQRKKNKQLLP